jgi:hypothetical protein
MAVPISARNTVAMRKQASYPSGDFQYVRIARFANSYRRGEITADDIPMFEREAVMVYLLEHPRIHGPRSSDG